MSKPERQGVHPDQALASYDYLLPSTQIAQVPIEPRDHSRLLVVGKTPTISDAYFWELPQLLKRGDLLVFNNTRVIPARLYGQKPTGGNVEILLVRPRSQTEWLALVKPGKHFRIDTKIVFKPRADVDRACALTARVIERDRSTGGRWLTFEWNGNEAFETILARYGELPLPPYITETNSAPERYQTIYASQPGAIAAPTAGLHFTPKLFQRLAEEGIQTAEICLHVGIGTFRPVETSVITAHEMHREWLTVDAEVVEKIQQTKAAGSRVYAVGTTVVRALEGAVHELGQLSPFTGETKLFIYPGYRWQVVDGVITNFHLPRSSLLMLVSALIGRERLLSIYKAAIAKEYRFYSFGDAMLILPEANVGA